MGDLVEIRRFYRQDGKIVHSPPTKILGSKATDSITDQFCADKKELFEDVNDFMAKGGNRAMGESLDRGQSAKAAPRCLAQAPPRVHRRQRRRHRQLHLNQSHPALRWKRRSRNVFNRAMFLNVSTVLLPTLETVVALAKALQRARQHYQGQ